MKSVMTIKITPELDNRLRASIAIMKVEILEKPLLTDLMANLTLLSSILITPSMILGIMNSELEETW